MSWLTAKCQEQFSGIPVSLLGALALLTVISLTRYIRCRTRNKYPVVGKSSDTDFRMAIKEGMTKYPNSPFVVPSNPEFLIMPNSALHDIKTSKEEEVSFGAALAQVYYPKVTKFGTHDPLLVSVVKMDISRQIASSLPFLQEEAVHSFSECFGPCEDWTSFTFYPTIAKIVARVSGRVFVGRPLSRNEEWIDANINYTFQVSKTKNALLKLPRWSVNIVGPYLKEVKALNKFRDHASGLLKPILEAQLTKNSNEKLYSEEGDEKGNGIAWILARMESNEQRNPELITRQLLGLSFAAIHTTTITSTQAIFDLATYRQYIPILVDEIKKVIDEDGYDITGDGVLRLRKSSMPKLAKLDSFLKESQRMNPLSLISHSRRTVNKVTLSSGHTIPKDTNIAVPIWYIHNESAALYSPGLTKPLNEFDGLRFFNLRQLPGNENRHLFVTSSPVSLSFGYGNHVCPGRFFAGNEIKLILIELLCNWEFRHPDDVKLEGGAWRRPRNKYHGLQCIPDTNARLEIRKKKY